MFFNRLTLIGYLGRDGERRVTPNGTPYTMLSIATKNSWKDANGNWQERTEWHRGIVWGEKFAEFAASLKKGAHVQIEGPLRSRQYEKDGVKHRIFECKVESILKLDRAEHEETPVAEDTVTEAVPF